jgi:hypothetical protein
MTHYMRVDDWLTATSLPLATVGDDSVGTDPSRV